MARFLTKSGLAVAFVAACLLFGLYVALPSIPRWSVLHAAAASLALWWAVRVSRDELNGLTVNRIGFASILFIGWASLSLLWSPDPLQGTEQIIRLLVIAVIAVFVSSSSVRNQELERILPHLVSASLLGAMLFYWKWPALHGGFGNPNFLAEFIIICIPFAAWKLGEHTLRYDLLRLTALGWGLYHLFFVSPSNLKYLALALWLCLVAFHFLKKGAWFTALLIVLVPVNIGFLTGKISFTICPNEGSDIACSLQARFEVWWNTAVLWWNFPWVGTGFGGFNYFYPLYQEAHLSWMPKWTVMMPVAQFAGAAHNEVLQTLAELGSIGLGVAVLCLVLALRGVRYEGINRPALWTLIVAGVVSTINFPLHTPPTALIAGCALGCLGRGRAAVLTLGLPRIRFMAAPAALAFSLIVVWAGVLSYKAEMLFSITQAKISEDPLLAFWSNAAAAQIYPLHSHYRHQLILTLRAVTDFRPDTVRIEPDAADKAYELSRSASPFNPGIVSAWVGYLLNTGRQNEPGQNVEGLLSQLKTTASLQAVTWLVEAVYALQARDYPRARNALAEGWDKAASRERQFMPEFERLAGVLNKGVAR